MGSARDGSPAEAKQKVYLSPDMEFRRPNDSEKAQESSTAHRIKEHNNGDLFDSHQIQTISGAMQGLSGVPNADQESKFPQRIFMPNDDTIL